MEFRTTTFNRDDEQPSVWQPTLNYILILIILMLVMYLLYQFEVPRWIMTIAILAVVGMSAFVRFHDMGKKENIRGNFGRDLELTSNFLRIDELKINMKDINSIQIDIEKYEGQMVPYHSTYERSDGVSNRITVVTNGQSYTELFRLGNERHYHDLILTTRELKENGINVVVNDKS